MTCKKEKEKLKKIKSICTDLWNPVNLARRRADQIPGETLGYHARMDLADVRRLLGEIDDAIHAIDRTCYQASGGQQEETTPSQKRSSSALVCPDCQVDCKPAKISAGRTVWRCPRCGDDWAYTRMR